MNENEKTFQANMKNNCCKPGQKYGTFYKEDDPSEITWALVDENELTSGKDTNVFVNVKYCQWCGHRLPEFIDGEWCIYGKEYSPKNLEHNVILLHKTLEAFKALKALALGQNKNFTLEEWKEQYESC